MRFNMRIEPALTSSFTKATEAADKPVAQNVRDFMPAYVRQSERRAFETNARRQSREAGALAQDPNSDEHAVVRQIDAELADESFWPAD